jgi:alkylation response protein AidB-like acyl-CoA dehydrogenase
MTRLEKIGNRCSLSWDIGLEDVAVGPDALIGAPGEGFAVLQRTLFHARSGLASAVVGTAQAAVDAAAAHARERVQFGRPIGAFQTIAHRLARMQTEVDLARLMARALARGIDAGADCNRLAAQAKYVATETLKRVTEEGMQIMASAAYAEGSDMGRYWRDARLYTFGEGSSEIQLELIARDMGLGRALEGRG